MKLRLIIQSSYAQNLSGCEVKAWKKNSAWTFFTFYVRVLYILKSQSGQPPSGLIVHLVELYTGIAEVMGSNPFNFSGFNFITA